jgi:hypothetical protein
VLLVLGVPVLLFGGLIYVMMTGVQSNNANFNLALTIDLLLTIPLVYFLLIRKTSIPKTTIVPVIVLGLIIGTVFLPSQSQSYLELFKMWVMPVVELTVVTFVVLKVRKTIKKYNSIKEGTIDFYEALKQVGGEVLPKKVVMPFVTEVAVIYYGFISWRTEKLKENEFTYHKESGARAVLGVFIGLVLIETFALHLLLLEWNEIIAWVLFGLSFYTALQLFGFTKSLSRRPIRIEEKKLKLRYGILSETEIKLADIVSIQKWTKDPDENNVFQKLSPLGELDAHNVQLVLKNEIELIGLYGLKNKFKVLYFHVDEVDQFLNSTNAKITKI